MTSCFKYEHNSTMRQSVIIGLLIIISIYTYQNVLNIGFIPLDDNMYIYGNALVRKGLSEQSILWAFSHVYFENYAPVTLLSHMLDVELFSLNSGLHHISSLVLHTLNAILLCLLLLNLFKSRSLAFCGALIFLLHPICVESVAWLSARKDLLAGSFTLITLNFYSRYLESKLRKYYLLAFFAFCLGLLAKTSLIPFALILILFDLVQCQKINFRSKIPFFAAAWTAYYIQSSAINKGFSVPLLERINYAVFYYIQYLKNFFYPTELTILYNPEPSLELSIISWLIMCSLSFLALKFYRSKPLLLLGWFWFVLAIGMYVQIVPSGIQKITDRWMYLPQIGLIIFSLEFVRNLLRSKFLKGLVILSLLCCVFILNQKQLSFWSSTERLFSRAVEVSPEWSVPKRMTGNYYKAIHQDRDAANFLLQALEIEPYESVALSLLETVGSLQEVQNSLSNICKFESPRQLDFYNYLLSLEVVSKSEVYKREFFKVCGVDISEYFLKIVKAGLEHHPNNRMMLSFLASAYEKNSDFEAAVEAYKKILRIETSDITLNNYASTLNKLNQLDEAEKLFRQAIDVNPLNIEAQENLLALYLQQMKIDRAALVVEDLKYIMLSPSNNFRKLEILLNIYQNKLSEAEEQLKGLLQIDTSEDSLAIAGKFFKRKNDCQDFTWLEAELSLKINKYCNN